MFNIRRPRYYPACRFPGYWAWARCLSAGPRVVHLEGFWRMGGGWGKSARLRNKVGLRRSGPESRP